MNSKTRLLLTVVALLSGLGVAVGIYGLTAPRSDAQNFFSTVAAQSKLEPGTVLTPAHLNIAQHPKGEAPEGDFTRIESVVGRVVKENLATEVS